MLFCFIRERIVEILRNPIEITFPLRFYLLEGGHVEIFYLY